jgi:hypothetical protein
MLVAGVLFALSIFFVFRPHQPLSMLQPPHRMLSATPCGAHPETSAVPAEYTCETPTNPNALGATNHLADTVGARTREQTPHAATTAM